MMGIHFHYMPQNRLRAYLHQGLWPHCAFCADPGSEPPARITTFITTNLSFQINPPEPCSSGKTEFMYEHYCICSISSTMYSVKGIEQVHPGDTALST